MDPNWITPLEMERTEALSPKTNPFFDHARMQLFLATRARARRRPDQFAEGAQLGD